jgi:hypothetical protein
VLHLLDFHPKFLVTLDDFSAEDKLILHLLVLIVFNADLFHLSVDGLDLSFVGN